MSLKFYLGAESDTAAFLLPLVGKRLLGLMNESKEIIMALSV